MKDKIIAAIKAKYPAINLSKARLAKIAGIIEGIIIDDETKIDATLDDFNRFSPIAEIAKQDDAIRNLEAKAKDKKPAAATPKKESEEEDVEVVDEIDPATGKPKVKPEAKSSDEVPAWAKILIESNKNLSSQLEAINKEKTQSSLMSRLTKEGLKDVPVSYWGKRPLPEDKEEDVEAFVAEVVADYTTFKQEMTDTGTVVLEKPKDGVKPGAGGAGGEKKVDPEISKFAEKQKASLAQQNGQAASTT